MGPTRIMAKLALAWASTEAGLGLAKVKGEGWRHQWQGLIGARVGVGAVRGECGDGEKLGRMRNLKINIYRYTNYNNIIYYN